MEVIFHFVHCGVGFSSNLVIYFSQSFSHVCILVSAVKMNLKFPRRLLLTTNEGNGYELCPVLNLMVKLTCKTCHIHCFAVITDKQYLQLSSNRDTWHILPAVAAVVP